MEHLTEAMTAEERITWHGARSADQHLALLGKVLRRQHAELERVREEANAALNQIARLTAQHRFDRARIDILACRPLPQTSAAVRQLNRTEEEWLKTHPDPVQEHIRELEAEIARLHREYRLMEEMSPPDVPPAAFVEWCYGAWEEKCELGQAFEYLFSNQWMMKLHHSNEDRVLVIGHHNSNPTSWSYGDTPAEAIIALAAEVAKSMRPLEQRKRDGRDSQRTGEAQPSRTSRPHAPADTHLREVPDTV